MLLSVIKQLIGFTQFKYINIHQSILVVLCKCWLNNGVWGGKEGEGRLAAGRSGAGLTRDACKDFPFGCFICFILSNLCLNSLSRMQYYLSHQYKCSSSTVFDFLQIYWIKYVLYSLLHILIRYLFWLV